MGEEDNIYYIVMEYVDGKTLKQLIKEKGKLSIGEIVDFARQIALALNMLILIILFTETLSPILFSNRRW